MAGGNYLLALYVAVPLSIVFCALVGVLCYLCCCRRNRLNWYDRTLLDGLKTKHDSEKDFLQRPHEQSHTSLDQCGSGLGVYKQGLPSITIGHGSTNVVTRKVKRQQGSDSASMGSSSSHDSDSSPSSDSGSIRSPQHPSLTQTEKHVSFGTCAPMATVPSNAARRTSMTAPIIPGGRRGSQSPSNGNGDSRRDSAEFWVPPTVLQKKRAQSLVPTLGLFQRPDPDDQKDTIPSASPSTMSRSQPEMSVTYPFDKSLTETVSLVQVPAHRGRRRASMQDALDPTLINKQLYEQMQQSRSKKESISSIQEEDRGSINIALEYDPEQGLLTVKLIQAHGLVGRNFSGTCAPYCKIAVLPHRKHELQSRVHKNTQNPQFEEEFMFSVQPQQIENRTLQVLVYAFDQYSRDECMGQVLILLDSVDLTTRQELWRPIGSTEEVDNHGDIMFSLGYLPSAERLTIVVLKARNLSLSSESTSRNVPNPMVKVSIISNDKRIKKKKTGTIRNTTDPVWNEELAFDLSKRLLTEISLDITVYSDNVIGNNEIGKVVIGPDSSPDERAHWNDMLNSKNAKARWHRLCMSS